MLPYFFFTSNNLFKSRPAEDAAEPFESKTPTILGFNPCFAYRSSDLESNSFAKLCPTTPKPDNIIRNIHKTHFGIN